MTPVPVSIAGDVTWGNSTHLLAPPDTLELPAWMDWPAGSLVHQLANSPSVSHKGQPIVVEGHDLGLLLHTWEKPWSLRLLPAGR
jgi:hypothetical protein